MSSQPPYEPAPLPPRAMHPTVIGGSPQPPRKGHGVLIAVILGLCVTCVLVCCGGGLWLMNFGFGVMATEIQDELATAPEMQEHIGSIESFDVNWSRSVADEDEDAFFYDVEGSEGSGYVRVKHHTDEFGREVIESAELTLKDGRKIPISIDP